MKAEYVKYGLDEVRIKEFELKKSVKDMGMDKVMSIILPSDISPPSSFESVGSIAITYLRPIHLPFAE